MQLLPQPPAPRRQLRPVQLARRLEDLRLEGGHGLVGKGADCSTMTDARAGQIPPVSRAFRVLVSSPVRVSDSETSRPAEPSDSFSSAAVSTTVSVNARDDDRPD
jgi:hypothetical protein